MLKKYLLLLTFSLLTLKAQAQPQQKTIPHPAKVEQQLQEAEIEFEHAEDMFDPWYAGPLLTGSAHVLPAGKFNAQPYLFVTANHARYDNNGHSHSINHDIITINPLAILQFGVINRWLDGYVQGQLVNNRQDGHASTAAGDTKGGLGVGLLKEGVYCPALKFIVNQTFPTGRYKHLNPKKGGIDATGGGSYATTLTLNFAKIVWWWMLDHPMNFRLSTNYFIPAHVAVKGFNAYGGGDGTRGIVKPGQGFIGNFGYEFSFTQEWVFALDTQYTYFAKAKFTGNPGRDSAGATATVGGPLSEQLSLAPAIEYNPTPNIGVIGGVWFTVWGRNSLNFLSGIISCTATF
jgi:hypothetical protein